MQTKLGGRCPTYATLNLVFYSGEVLSEMKARFQPRRTGAQIRHKSHPASFRPLNHRSPGRPCFVHSANMLTVFLPPPTAPPFAPREEPSENSAVAFKTKFKWNTCFFVRTPFSALSASFSRTRACTWAQLTYQADLKC